MQPSQVKRELLLPKNIFTGQTETSPFYPLPARRRMMKYKPSLADDFIRKFKTAEEISLREYIGLENIGRHDIDQAEELRINNLLRINAIHINYRHQYQAFYRRMLLSEVLTSTKVKNIRSRGYILQFEFEDIIPESAREVMKAANEFITILFNDNGNKAYKYLSEQLHINGNSGMFSSFDYFMLRFKDLWSRCELLSTKLEVEKIDKEVAIIGCRSAIKRNSKSPKEEIHTQLKLLKRKEWWTIYSIESDSFPEIIP
ncbi:MAG TPA: hypothetical protein PLG57_13330 [Bacteroidia bacterium]|jgi:hypothetical protein|nr:hypothetical protein [Bacteroidia bacterium]HQK98630.1 hypothetical protein [Bacteroidia bacterium]